MGCNEKLLVATSRPHNRDSVSNSQCSQPLNRVGAARTHSYILQLCCMQASSAQLHTLMGLLLLLKRQQQRTPTHSSWYGWKCSNFPHVLCGAPLFICKQGNWGYFDLLWSLAATLFFSSSSCVHACMESYYNYTSQMRYYTLIVVWWRQYPHFIDGVFWTIILHYSGCLCIFYQPHNYCPLCTQSGCWVLVLCHIIRHHHAYNLHVGYFGSTVVGW